MSLEDIVKELQGVLARLQCIDLWPPSDAIATVWNALETVARMASVAPDPDPVRIREIADGWRDARDTWDEAVSDLRTTENATDTSVWDGSAGDAYRSSLAATRKRFGSVVTATGGVRVALLACAGAMDDARKRHGDAQRSLLECFEPIWLNPFDPTGSWEAITGRVSKVVRAIAGLITAYGTASVAVRDCRAAMQRAIDDVQLPRHRVDGMSAISQTNQPSSSGGDAQDKGPLRGTTAERAQAALDAMSPEERAAVEALLKDARTDEERAWILAGVASGLTGGSLAAYAAGLKKMTPAQLRAMDPTTSSGVYTQPDGTTCGSSSLVMSRMLNDPAYAMYIQTGVDPRGILPDASNLTPAERFDKAALDMHDKTNTYWPEAWGTFPTSADEQMSATNGGSGVPGATYSSTIVDPKSLGKTYDAILDAVSNGHTVPMYTYGIGVNGNLQNSGAHVTLVVGASGDNVTVYEPGSGEYRAMTRDQFVNGKLSGPGGWDNPLTVSLPK